MTAKEIKEFQTLIGDKADYMLFGDNAINFLKRVGSYIFISEQEEMLYYFCNIGNTMENPYTPVEFDKCHTENIQYAQAFLTQEQANIVLNKLKTDSIISADLYTKMIEDKILFGLSSREIKPDNITII